jgi:hypothetical protein
MIAVEQLADPVVRAFVAAVNAGDRDAFFALLAPGAAMSDDGSEPNLRSGSIARSSPRTGAWSSSGSPTTAAR